MQVNRICLDLFCFVYVLSLLDRYLVMVCLRNGFCLNCYGPYAGDVNSVSIGSGTNIQDNSLVHVAKSNLTGKVLPTLIGNNVTVG